MGSGCIGIQYRHTPERRNMEGGKEAFDSSATGFLLWNSSTYQFMDIRMRVSEASDGAGLPASMPLREDAWAVQEKERDTYWLACNEKDAVLHLCSMMIS